MVQGQVERPVIAPATVFPDTLIPAAGMVMAMAVEAVLAEDMQEVLAEEWVADSAGEPAMAVGMDAVMAPGAGQAGEMSLLPRRPNPTIRMMIQ